MADSETTPGLSSSLGGNGEESPCDDDLDRMLLQARISGLGNTLPSLPWESGVMSCIFGDGLLSRPTFAQPRPPAPVADTRKDPLAEAKPSRVRAAPENLYERSFHARADVPVQEEEDHLWVLAINKWCCIFSLASWACPKGFVGCKGEEGGPHFISFDLHDFTRISLHD